MIRERDGDLWDQTDADAVVITTNGVVKRDGSAVMGRGAALQAAQRYPGISATLGRAIKHEGNRTRLLWIGIDDDGPAIVALPVKHHWRQAADPRLIRDSLTQLLHITNGIGWKVVVMPRPGCGNGRLNWADVKPMLDEILDDRFVVVERG